MPANLLEGRLALSVGEAAKALGVSERHLRTILPEIPHVYLGNRVVVPVDALRDWLKDRAKAQGSEADRLSREILRNVGD